MNEMGARIKVDKPATKENWQALLWECLTELDPNEIAAGIKDVFNEQGVADILQALTDK